MKREYTDIEISILRELYPEETAAYIAAKLNRPISSVYGKANSLGLKKSEAFYKSEKSGRLNGTQGEETRFCKGQVAHNKGKKLSTEEKAKIKHTFFKKGHKPHNTKSDGQITKRSCGYYWIRVSESSWMHLHRYLWEKEFGKIPPDMNVVFKDGNPENCTVNNLTILSNRDLMHKNQIHDLPTEIQEIIRLNNKLISKINDYGKK